MVLTEDNKIVHGLWIGKSLSVLELLTIESFLYNGHIFYLWIYNPISNTLPDAVIVKDANLIIPENEIFHYKKRNQYGHGKGSPGGFSDIFRYKLLYEYGGWWTDMDITCLQPLNFTQEYVFRTHHELLLVGNLLKCPEKSDLMKHCYERAVKEITSHNMDWNKPIQILIDEVRNNKLENYIIELSNHDSWKIIRKFLLRNEPLPKNWKVFHWVNVEWKRNRVSKETYIADSTFGLLLKKHKLTEKKSPAIKRVFYWINLTYLVAAFRQLPWFVKRKLYNNN